MQYQTHSCTSVSTVYRSSGAALRVNRILMAAIKAAYERNCCAISTISITERILDVATQYGLEFVLPKA